MPMRAHYCHRCGAPWKSEARQPGFKEICHNCDAYLHCCRNCRFHKPTAHNQCYIPDTEYVANRDGLNFCEEFVFREGKPASSEKADKQQQARDALAGLFGDDDSQAPPASFDDLFTE